MLLVHSLLAGERLHVRFEKRSREGAPRRAWNICLEKGTGELVPRGACDIATNVSVSPGKGSVLGIFPWKKGWGSWCHRVPAILLPTFRGACLEYLLGKRDGGVGASWCLRYCYQYIKKLWEGEDARNAFKEVTVAAHVGRPMAKS